MTKRFNFTLIISWAGSIFIAWIGGNILWYLLEFSVGYNFTKRALAEMMFFFVTSIASSSYRDLNNITNSSPQTQESAHDNIDINPYYRLREIIIFGMRIALAGYLCSYWFIQGRDWAAQSTSIQLPDRVPNMFLVLLVLWIFLLVNTTITYYMIVIEPWRIFVARNREHFTSKRIVFSLSGFRIFTLAVISLLWFWFCQPILEVKIPATLSFVAVVLLIWGVNIYYRRH